MKRILKGDDEKKLVGTFCKMLYETTKIMSAIFRDLSMNSNIFDCAKNAVE